MQEEYIQWNRKRQNNNPQRNIDYIDVELIARLVFKQEKRKNDAHDINSRKQHRANLHVAKI